VHRIFEGYKNTGGQAMRTVSSAKGAVFSLRVQRKEKEGVVARVGGIIFPASH